MAEAENKMGTMSIRRLILHMSWPMMLSMLIQALYNMVDSFFVAQIDERAFVALSLAYPVQTLMIAICTGLGVGINAMLSRRLGEGRRDEASAVALNGYLVYFLAWLVFLVFGLTLGSSFVGFFHQDSVVREYGAQYLTIVTTLSIGVCMQFAAERVLQATGDAVGPMVVQGVGAAINIVLDPVLIFGLGPFPAMGVAGAAIATVFGQIVGMGFGFFLVSRNRVLVLRLRGFRPSLSTIGDILHIGAPAIVMQSLATVMNLGMNKILALPAVTAHYQDGPVFLLGAYFKLQSFVFMPVYGMNNALTPILSYNYGARHRRRITDGIRFALLVATGIMAAGTLVFLLLPGPLLAIFNPSGETMALGVTALRILAPAFLFAGVSIILGAAFQALGAPMYSLVVSLLRQLVVVLPVCLVFALLSPGLVWWSIPIAEAAACGAAFLLYRRVHRTKISALEEA